MKDKGIMQTPVTPAEARNQFKVMLAEMEDCGIPRVEVASFVKTDCDFCPQCDQKFFCDDGAGSFENRCCCEECYDNWLIKVQQEQEEEERDYEDKCWDYDHR